MTSLKSVIKNIIPPWVVTYKTAEKGILLTFDDGPDPDITPLILDLLEQYRIHAVFFVLGKQVAKHPKIIQRIVANGHCIGNHSFRHKTADELSFGDYSDDLNKCQNILKPFITSSPTLFRPPEGRLSFLVWFVIKYHRMQVMLWSIESGEWGKYSHESADQMFDRLVSDIKPHDIVLMHDNSRKVLLLLEKLLPVLVEKGDEFINPKQAFPYLHHH